MSGVLALALQRLALSHGTLPNAVPVGHPANGETNGTIWTAGTIGTDGTSWASKGAPRDLGRGCLVCGQPAHFGFGVRLREAQEGRWFCAAHRPQQPGTA
jgi:hypothetical protein